MKTSKMETLLIIAIWFAVLVILWQLFSFTTIKKSNHARTPPNKKEQKLLRFQRGHKTLTPEQQERLRMLNERNLFILKSEWRDEHL